MLHQEMKRIGVVWTLGFVLTIGLTGCGRGQETTRGVFPAGGSIVTTQEVSKATSARQVTLRGEMIEKCPVAGCWFKLRDGSGVVRVDTKAAGFVVSDVPLHTQITVRGKIVPGAEAGIAASGIRY
jgi:uncharacterized protein YdeI (BOF family)